MGTGTGRRAAATRRITRDSAGWRGEGRAARELARRTRRCVECQTALESGRSPYCSPGCLWRHHGRFFWDAARQVVLRRDRYTCQWCGVRRTRRGLEVDHVVEVARGGPSLDYRNLQTLCTSCHREKTRVFQRSRRPVPPPEAAVVWDDGAAWFPA